MEECGFPSPPPAPYKGGGLGLGHPTQPIKARESRGLGPTFYLNPQRSGFLPPPFATPSAWEPCGRRAEPRRRVRRPLPHPVIVGSGRLENRASAPFSK